jgi:hypothetical protein
MVRLTEDELALLASRFTTELQAIAPGWTDRNEHDPGITLLELFAFLTNNLLYRSTPTPRGNHVIDAAIAALTALRGPDGETSDGPIRNHYFAGKVLTAEDFQIEQDYNITKRRHHTRWLHGCGVVTGLQVGLDDSSTPDEPVVIVNPGVAIDANGEEIIIPSPRSCRLRATAATGFVTVEYTERFLNPVPGLDLTAITRPSRIEEGVRVAFAEHASDHSVTIARLTRRENTWHLAAIE